MMRRITSDRARAAAVMGVGFGIAGLALLVTGLQGGLGLPEGDAFAYTRIALHFGQTGDLSFVGWGEMALIGHVVTGGLLIAVLGAHTAVLNLLGFALALATAAFVLLAGRRWSGPLAGAVAAATFVASPVVLLTSLTFDTDVPAAFAMLGCLLLGTTALTSIGVRRSLLLAASLLIAVYGMGVRETVLVVPVALVLVGVVSGALSRRTAALYLLASVGALATIYAVRSGVPGQQQFSQADSLSPLDILASAVHGLATAALLLLPCLAFWRPVGVRALTRSQLVVLAVVGAGIALTVARPVAHGLWPGIVGVEVLGFASPFGNSYGITAPSLPAGVAHVLDVIALLALLAVAAATVEMVEEVVRSLRARRPDERVLIRSVGLVALGLYLAGIGVRLLQGNQLFDRYWVPLLAIWPLVYLAGERVRSVAVPTWRVAATVVGIALLGVCGLVKLSAGVRVDAELWKSGRALAASEHLARSEVDAGVIWSGTYYHGLPRARRPLLEVAGATPFYASLFPQRSVCAVVSTTPLPDDDRFRLVSRRSFVPLGTRKQRTAFGYRVRPCARSRR